MSNRIDWCSFFVGACSAACLYSIALADPLGVALNLAAVVLNVLVIRRRQS